MHLAEPPRVEAASHPTEMSIAVGTPLELACVVTGVPVPTVTWEKDGRLLAGPWLVSGNESTFHIESTKVRGPLLPTCILFSCLNFSLSWLCVGGRCWLVHLPGC